MEKFTVKDFITYNNPCFSCGENIHIKVVSAAVRKDEIMTLSDIRPSVTLDSTTMDLKVTYNKTLRLSILHKTNKISFTDFRLLSEYFVDHKLFLKSSCNKCHTSIESFFLDFNMEQCYLKPTGINKEILCVTDKLNNYFIYSDVFSGKSEVVVTKTYGPPTAPIMLNTPLILLHKLKTRKRLIEKLKTYLIFS